MSDSLALGVSERCGRRLLQVWNCPRLRLRGGLACPCWKGERAPDQARTCGCEPPRDLVKALGAAMDLGPRQLVVPERSLLENQGLRQALEISLGENGTGRSLRRGLPAG